MTTNIKYNLTNTVTNDNPFIGMLGDLSTALYNMLGYGILVFIFLVVLYVTYKRTQDPTKSLVTTWHVVSWSTFFLYYTGKIEGFILIHDLTLYGILILYCIGLIYALFMKMQPD